MSGTILIVDDEEHIRTVLGEYLHDRGHTVFEANKLAAAREHLRNGLRPDVVVLDVMLGDGDGIAFLRELRTSLAPSEVPVIMISARKITSTDRISGLETGADDYMVKPFDLRELALKVERLMKRHPRASASSPDNRTSPSNTEAMSSVIKGILSANTELPPIPAAPKSGAPLPPLNAGAPAAPVAANPPQPGPRPAIASASPAGATVRREGAGDLNVAAVLVGALALLVQPKTFFSAYPRAIHRYVGILSLFLLGLLQGLQSGIEQRSLSIGFVHGIMAPAAYAGGAALVAWIIQWSMGLRQKPVKFRAVFSALMMGLAPLVLATMLGVMYVAVANGRAGDLTASPLLFFPSQSSSRFVGALLRRLDAFEIWAVWLSSLALHQRLEIRPRSAYQLGFVLWLIVLAAHVAISGFFA